MANLCLGKSLTLELFVRPALVISPPRIGLQAKTPEVEKRVRDHNEAEVNRRVKMRNYGELSLGRP